MSLLRLNEVYFIEYGNETTGMFTRLFRFYPEEYKVKSIFVTGGDVNKQINIGIAAALEAMDSNNSEIKILESIYHLDENYQIKFTLGKDQFHGALALDHSYISIDVKTIGVEDNFKGSLFQFDLIKYIQSKELNVPYFFE